MTNEEMEELFPRCPPFKCTRVLFYSTDTREKGLQGFDVTQDNLELIKKYIECIEESFNG